MSGIAHELICDLPKRTVDLALALHTPFGPAAGSCRPSFRRSTADLEPLVPW